MIIPIIPPSLLGPLHFSWINRFRECVIIEELNIAIIDIKKCIMEEGNKLMQNDYVLDRGIYKQNTDMINAMSYNNQGIITLLQQIRRLKK